MEEQLIAPCGINCYICPQYQIPALDAGREQPEKVKLVS